MKSRKLLCLSEPLYYAWLLMARLKSGELPPDFGLLRPSGDLGCVNLMSSHFPPRVGCRLFNREGYECSKQGLCLALGRLRYFTTLPGQSFCRFAASSRGNHTERTLVYRRSHKCLFNVPAWHVLRTTSSFELGSSLC